MTLTPEDLKYLEPEFQKLAELEEMATSGEFYWSKDYPSTHGGECLSLISSGEGGYGVLSCDGMANSPTPQDANFIEEALNQAKPLLTALITERKRAEALTDRVIEMSRPYGQERI